MPGDEKAKGPASYFPSIEKTYGKPVRHWLKLLDSLQDKKHMEQVAYLKSEHKMGHGHANALVAYHRAQSKAPSSRHAPVVPRVQLAGSDGV